VQVARNPVVRTREARHVFLSANGSVAVCDPVTGDEVVMIDLDDKANLTIVAEGMVYLDGRLLETFRDGIGGDTDGGVSVVPERGELDGVEEPTTGAGGDAGDE